MRIWIKDEIWKRCEEALDNRCSLLSHSDVQNDKSVSLDSVQYSTVVYAGLVTDWKHMEKRETIELSMQILELIALKMKVFWSTEHEKRREIIWYLSGIRYPVSVERKKLFSWENPLCQEVSCPMFHVSSKNSLFSLHIISIAHYSATV